MKTSKSIIERKMSVYWLTLLLFNGTNVYPGHKYSGKIYFSNKYLKKL